MLDDAAPEAGADWLLDSGDATVQRQSFCGDGSANDAGPLADEVTPVRQAAMASTLVKPSGHQGMSVHSTAARSNQAHRPLERTVLDRSATQTRG